MSPKLVQWLGLQANILFPGGFFLRVFFHPRFPASAGGRVAAGKGQRGDIGVTDGHFFVGVLGEEADHGISQGASAAPVEEVAFDFRSVLAGVRDATALVESLFERDAAFFLTREIRDPAFKLFMLGARYNFE